MIHLEAEAWTRPALGLPAPHRSWCIRWTYGDQAGLVAAETCSCTPGPCRGMITPSQLRAQLRAAIAAGMARQHGQGLRCASRCATGDDVGTS